MCGRYTMNTDAAALAERFHVQLPAEMVPTYNAAPSRHQLTILDAAPHVTTVSTWGFVPECLQEKIELAHVCPAVHVERQMVEPRRRAVIFPLLSSPPGTFEGDGKHALVRISNGPTRHCRRAGIHGDSAVAQQG